ncbi:GntP family permease [Enterococcus camelliae]|uniref:GntP family permease n=1 Tax=Enterococcus camelliae TaxID=453959 RepID=A0ABW5TGJ4_9ENTE
MNHSHKEEIILTIIGVLIGIIFIIWLSMKNISILIVAPLATMLVIVFNQMSIYNIFLSGNPDSFMFSLANYVLRYFWIFLLGSILANLMEESRATDAIAQTIVNKIGTDRPYNILLAIFLISFILTFGGISLFVAMFAIIPLARVLFQKANISWHLIQIPLWLGICTVTMTVLPGSPSIQNIIPIDYLDTSLTAAFLPSLVASVVCVGFGLWYMGYALKRSQSLGQQFATFATVVETKKVQKELPSFEKSILPLATLIVISFCGSLFGNDFLKKNVIYFALVIAVALCILLFRKSFSSIVGSLNKGASGAVLPIFSTAAAVAFGSIVVKSDGFATIQELLFSLPVPSYVNLGLFTAIMSGITGSSSGALGIVMPNYAEYYLHSGLDKEMIHRIATIGSNILTIVPQSGVFITFIGLTKLTPKTGFKESFITVFVGSLLAEIVVVCWALFVG